MTNIATEDELSSFLAEEHLVIDVRGAEEIVTLGNKLEGSVNIHYNQDLPSEDAFLESSRTLLPENKSTRLVVH